MILQFIRNTHSMHVGEVKSLHDIYEQRLRYLTNDCNNLICSLPGGLCSKEGKCQCFQGYITVQSQTDHKLCNYCVYFGNVRTCWIRIHLHWILFQRIYEDFCIFPYNYMWHSIYYCFFKGEV